jgi:Domain of unknown function (DUF4394)/PQQ-like domain
MQRRGMRRPSWWGVLACAAWLGACGDDADGVDREEAPDSPEMGPVMDTAGPTAPSDRPQQTATARLEGRAGAAGSAMAAGAGAAAGIGAAPAPADPVVDAGTRMPDASLDPSARVPEVPPLSPALLGNAYAITSLGRVLGLDTLDARVLGVRELSGLKPDESVIGADVRPADGQLYALTSAARVVVVDLESGEALEQTVLTAVDDDTTEPFAGLLSARLVLDWQPIDDRLLAFGGTRNLELDADSGGTITSPALLRRAAPLQPAAYAFATDGSARLYAIDMHSHTLLAQDPEKPDEWVQVGKLEGAGQAEIVDFEITATPAGATVPLIVVSDAESVRVMDINLATGSLTCPRPIALEPGESLLAFSAVLPQGLAPAPKR